VRVLVTGASSMIGRHTVAVLMRRGDHVTTLQRTETGLGDSEVNAPLDDATAVGRACEGQDAVLHLAAKVGAVGQWNDYHRTNVDGTADLIAAAKAASVSRFVHVSSPSVAHAGEPLVGAEAEPADPGTTRGHYATSKALAEVHALAESSAVMPIVAVRPHLVWGPGDTQLVGRIIDRCRQGRLAVVGSGLALIDTTYVDNAADALVAAVDRAPDLGGRALVVSNGEPRTVHELVARMVAAAGLSWRARRVPARVAIAGGSAVERVWDRTGRIDDPPMTGFLAKQLSTAHWFAQDETRSALHWHPRVSLDEGFNRLQEWFAG
jgi:2-alkyl-3-oxoalkanoate reductase